MKKALLVIDIQNDFCKGGSLEVKDANDIIPYVNKLMESKEYDLIVGTKDWHPSNHTSFKSNHSDGIWPNHCIQNELGSEFHSELKKELFTKVFTKGMNPEVDSYSGFFDNDHINSTGMGEYLKSMGVVDVIIVGLALDYCVKFTAIDSLSFGFKTTVDSKGTKAVNLVEYDGERTILELKAKGITVL